MWNHRTRAGQYEKHPTRRATTRFATFDVDVDIAELVEMLHAEGIETLFSCQGDEPPRSAPWWRRAMAWWQYRRPGRGAEEPCWQRLWRALEVLEGDPGAGDQLHGYLLFPGSQAREFYALALEATAGSGDPHLDLIHRRLQHSLLRESVQRCLSGGTSGASLWELATGRWYAEVLPGYPDMFEARTSVRFPHRDLAPLTAAVRVLLAAREGRVTGAQPSRMP